jgi:hypothetical protein
LGCGTALNTIELVPTSALSGNSRSITEVYLDLHSPFGE